MTTDSGIGVVRHGQAGYEQARLVAQGKGPLTDEAIQVPLWWSRQATFGPEDSGPARRGKHVKDD
jgi:urocanate hydratase